MIVEEALALDMVEGLTQVVDRIDAEERRADGLEPHALVNKLRTVVEDDLFFELLDNERTCPLLAGISSSTSRTSSCGALGPTALPPTSYYV